MTKKSRNSIPEDKSRLYVLKPENNKNQVDDIIRALKQDKVVLGQNFNLAEADAMMLSIAKKLGLEESLEIQAGFASSLGHRSNIGKYYMTVNKRSEYQCVAPHSEGDSFTNMQLASFFCEENTTDGGETILFNIDPTSDIWQKLREKVRRGKATRALTGAEIKQAKMMLRINMPEDELKLDDEVLKETKVNDFFSYFDVLAAPRKTYSKILNRYCLSYWDTIESIDTDSAKEIFLFLQENDILKLPERNTNSKLLDDAKERRIRNFGSRYSEIFSRKLTRKLVAGDFIIQNNLTWCHAVSNWTPDSGTRKVAAAFA